MSNNRKSPHQPSNTWRSNLAKGILAATIPVAGTGCVDDSYDKDNAALGDGHDRVMIDATYRNNPNAVAFDHVTVGFPEEFASNRIDLTKADEVAKALGIELDGHPSQVLYHIRFGVFGKITGKRVISVGNVDEGAMILGALGGAAHAGYNVIDVYWPRALTTVVDLTNAGQVAKAMGMELTGDLGQKLYDIDFYPSGAAGEERLWGGNGPLVGWKSLGKKSITVARVKEGANLLNRLEDQLASPYLRPPAQQRVTARGQ